MEQKRSYIAFVVARDGTPLMPCRNPKKVRRLLKEERARVFRHDPFTIQLLYESEKHEFVREELTLLSDEKQKHMAQVRYRRQRRNRLRHRRPRFDNRRKSAGWLAPSLRHKAAAHVSRALMYARVLPITSIVIETARFDTALLAALDRGEFLEGADYQHGLRYMRQSQRIAVFERDGYTCQVCGRNAFKDKVVLCQHHIGFRHGDRSDRATNFLTVCSLCHTPRNHKPGGKFWDLEPAGKLKSDSAFMNVVRYRIVEMFRDSFPGIRVEATYGALTAVGRRLRNLPKSHSNDAYAMGVFHPRHRAWEARFQKRRRNNRCLEKFFDARYHDTRAADRKDEGWAKSGQQLSSGRTKRDKASALNGEDLRGFRGHKVSTDHRSVRIRRYPIRPGDILVVDGHKVVSCGMHNNGSTVLFRSSDGKVKGKTPKKVKVWRHANGWVPV